MHASQTGTWGLVKKANAHASFLFPEVWVAVKDIWSFNSFQVMLLTSSVRETTRKVSNVPFCLRILCLSFWILLSLRSWQINSSTTVTTANKRKKKSYHFWSAFQVLVLNWFLSFAFYNHSVREVFISLFYRWRDWGSKRWTLLVKVLEPWGHKKSSMSMHACSLDSLWYTPVGIFGISQ